MMYTEHQSHTSHECSSGEFRATPNTHCHQFQTCLNNVWYLYSSECGKGLLFNNDLKTCVLAQKVDNTTCTTKTTTVTHAHTPVCTSGDFRAVPNTGCVRFHYCSHGQWDSLTSLCHGGTLFDNDRKTCVMANNVDTATCTAITKYNTATGTTTAAPLPCNYGDSHEAPNTGCRQFQQCANSLWLYKSRCPDGTLWNIDINTCDIAHNVDNTTCTTKHDTVTGTPAPACQTFDLRVAPNTRCQYFEICVNNEWHQPPNKCSDGYLWNSHVKSCQPAVNVNTTTCTTLPK